MSITVLEWSLSDSRTIPTLSAAKEEKNQSPNCSSCDEAPNRNSRYSSRRDSIFSKP